MWSRKTIVSVILLVGCLLGQMPTQAQNKRSKVLYADPTRLLLPSDKNAEYEGENGHLLREKFYPIGWSKSGAFAYYVEPADEACGCYFGKLIIQDLRTDKILWERFYNSEQLPTNTLKKYWAKNQKEFSRKLTHYGIKAQNKFDLQSSSIKYQKDVLTPEIKIDTKADDGEMTVSGSVIIQLISKAKGRKTIFEKKFDPKKVDSFRDAETSGSLLSPFEARAAIVMVETHRGYEGPPNITRIRIIGTNLTNGFQ